MASTVSGLIAHCKQAMKNNVQYIYGAKMQVLTYAQILALQKTYGKTCVWDSDLNKAGKLCCDCSGLISSYTGITRGSSNYNSTAIESATLSQVKANWNNYVGWAFWLSGHIGVVSDTEGYYYAMDGSASNMVHKPISNQNWKKAIKLCDIDYTSEVDEDMTADEVKTIVNQMISENQEAVYNTVDDVPSWGKETVEKLINHGALQGSDTGLELGYSLLRQLVINDRMGLYD